MITTTVYSRVSIWTENTIDQNVYLLLVYQYICNNIGCFPVWYWSQLASQLITNSRHWQHWNFCWEKIITIISNDHRAKWTLSISHLRNIYFWGFYKNIVKNQFIISLLAGIHKGKNLSLKPWYTNYLSCITLGIGKPMLIWLRLC